MAGESSKKWKPTRLCAFSAGIVALVVIVFTGIYVSKEPNSFPAFLLRKSGIRVFEPTFTAKHAGTELIGDIISYQSVEEVGLDLKAKGFHAVLEEFPPDKVPPRIFSVLRVESYMDLGQKGVLILQFFNDRLMSTSFWPDDSDTYLATLAKQRNLSFHLCDKLHTPPATLVERKGTARNGIIQPGVRWTDERLDDEELAWWIRNPTAGRTARKTNTGKE